MPEPQPPQPIERPDISTLTTPQNCIADFSLIPIGSHDASFSKQIAQIEDMLVKSGLKHQMTPTGTVLEGSWDQVSEIIGYAHTWLHRQNIPRIQTDIRITTRTDKVQMMKNSLHSVEKMLLGEPPTPAASVS
ncbi:hypothetical protein BBP40_011407 [Aspergillus hancockii]|nr:hypothetical protein BBP40_011407 [Aspergillus hancockii]